MVNLNVQIITLEPMRVASTYGFGLNPEEQAWQTMVAWAKPKGFLDDQVAHPVFGFNNPNPSPGNPKYGYEFWMKVGPEIEPEGDARIVEFMGGTYAVARCEAGEDPARNIPATWKALADWCKKNSYQFGYHQALEKLISNPDDPAQLVLDLYCPIVVPR